MPNQDSNQREAQKANLRQADRSVVRFESLAAVIECAQELANADADGRLRAAGNWTLGQTFSHLAWWANEAFEGYEFPFYLRVYFRLVGPIAKRKALRGEVPPGIRLPGVRGGTYGTEVLLTEDGLAAMRAAFERLDRECPAKPDEGFGRLSHAEWRTLHIRHAEHHLSYFHAEPVASARLCLSAHLFGA
jgi:hypothetical protein